MKIQKTAGILQEIKRTYSGIAEEFSASRWHPWPEFEELLKYSLHCRSHIQDSTYHILDVGCGNGRLFDFLRRAEIAGDIDEFKYTGIDNNPEMIRIAKKKNKGARFRLADAIKLPFPAHSFDMVWCIAALHHLPTPALRTKALKEMRRVLKKGGALALTVWNLLPQKKYRPFINQKTHDAEIPWGEKKQWKRYYYAFTARELDALLAKCGFHKITKVKSRHNLSLIAYQSYP